jgi:hypothetical protein
MKKFIYLTVVFLMIVSCITGTKDPQKLIDKTIEISGGEKYNESVIEFDFRDKHYKATRKGGNYKLERFFNDSINDVVTNSGFKRFINNEIVKVADSMIPRYTNSINSVHYFTTLPYGLNDPAVNKNFLEKVTIKGNEYYKIEVTFKQDSGGDDFDDVYVYWINTQSNKVDYLAYSFHVNGGGMRFREAYNERYINGLRFVDYNNYKSKNKDVTLFDLDVLFENNKLKLLSKIETENITVK